jgi:cell division initiation protein
MNFTPNDLQNIEFTKSLRGCNEMEVKELLQGVIEDYCFYIKENLDLKEKISFLNDGIQHYKDLEKSLNNTLIVAQQTGEDIKKTSYEKAENIVKEAEMKAIKIVNDAKEEVLKIKYDYEQMKRNLNAFRTKSESIIKFQLESLKEVKELEGVNIEKIEKSKNNEQNMVISS